MQINFVLLRSIDIKLTSKIQKSIFEICMQMLQACNETSIFSFIIYVMCK